MPNTVKHNMANDVARKIVLISRSMVAEEHRLAKEAFLQELKNNMIHVRFWSAYEEYTEVTKHITISKVGGVLYFVHDNTCKDGKPYTVHGYTKITTSMNMNIIARPFKSFDVDDYDDDENIVKQGVDINVPDTKVAGKYVQLESIMYEVNTPFIDILKDVIAYCKQLTLVV